MGTPKTLLDAIIDGLIAAGISAEAAGTIARDHVLPRVRDRIAQDVSIVNLSANGSSRGVMELWDRFKRRDFVIDCNDKGNDG